LTYVYGYYKFLIKVTNEISIGLIIELELRAANITRNARTEQRQMIVYGAQ